MRLQERASSVVLDALGLGTATVDVMYGATEAIIDVLSAVKSRLLAAAADGVDKQAIQGEIDTLKEHAFGIVASAQFGALNWLETDEADHLSDLATLGSSILSSFSRGANGTQSTLRKIDVDLKSLSMLNTGGGGILQKDLISLGRLGGFRDANRNAHAHNGHQDHRFTGPATFGASDFISFDLTVDESDHSPGETYTVTIDKAVIDAALGTTDGTIGNAAQMRAVLQQAFNNDGIPATAYSYWTSSLGSNLFEIGSTETSGHPGSSIGISNVTSSLPGGRALGLEDPVATLDHDNMYPNAVIWFEGPFTVQDGAEFYFDVQVGSGALTTVTVDHATVNAALGVSDGRVSSAADMAALLQHAAQGLGLSVTSSGNGMILSADQSIYPEAGNRAAHIHVGNVRDNIGRSTPFDLQEVDVTSQAFSIHDYIEGVDVMLSRATSSAARLGALKMRLDAQSGFVSKLIDAVDRGIGQLVDADMHETAMRLRALQAQEQLAIQSLQIANANTQTILSLFKRAA